MRQRIYIFRQPGMGQQGPNPLGCLFYLLGLAGLTVWGVFVLLPLLGVAFFIGLGVVAVGLVVVGYWRLRAWLRQKLGPGRDEPDQAGGHYEAEILDDEDSNDDDSASDGRPRLNVEVRRRPHRD